MVMRCLCVLKLLSVPLRLKGCLALELMKAIVALRLFPISRQSASSSSAPVARPKPSAKPSAAPLAKGCSALCKTSAFEVPTSLGSLEALRLLFPVAPHSCSQPPQVELENGGAILSNQ
eukprot:4232562-Amphidinium_carterae.1